MKYQILNPASIDGTCVVCQLFAYAFKSVSLRAIDQPSSSIPKQSRRGFAHADCVRGKIKGDVSASRGAVWSGPSFIDVQDGQVRVITKAELDELNVRRIVKSQRSPSSSSTKAKGSRRKSRSDSSSGGRRQR
jgi:hypothetical protein